MKPTKPRRKKQRGAAYSVDLRERVFKAIEEKYLTHKQAAELFDIGEATVDRWSRLRRETGGFAPRPHGGGQPRALNARGDRHLEKLVREKPDRTLDELKVQLRKRAKVEASTSAITRSLKRLGLTLKKSRSRR